MIIVRLSGGMGNQLFQYACGRALALRHNVPLKLDTTFLCNQTRIPFIRTGFAQRPYALDLFSIGASVAKDTEIPWYGKPFLFGWAMQCIDAVLRKIPILPGWEKRFVYDEGLWALGPHTYLAGFWQSHRYFDQIREVLLADLVPAHPLPDLIDQKRTELESQEVVCIHVRRSDFVKNSFHGEVDTSYYTQAVARIAQQTKIDRVYIFSDDIEWCKKHISVPYDTEYISNEYRGDRDIGHFMLMRACTHFVIPNSTFSWWAAWLGEKPHKIVVAPKKWFEKKSMNKTSIVPDSWVRI